VSSRSRADLLFCPTPHAVDLLAQEWHHAWRPFTGDVMWIFPLQRELADRHSAILTELDYNHGIITWDAAPTPTRMIPHSFKPCQHAGEVALPVVLPLHPYLLPDRTANLLPTKIGNLKLVEPVGYLDMLMLER
jgi:hypothetical protein